MSDQPQKIRLGIVGCGAVARRHALCLNADSRAVVHVCCDPNRAHAELLHREFFPKARIDVDERNVFDHLSDLDAVLICSPTRQHHRQVCHALDRGLHVLCEKPLSIQREEILEIIERTRLAARIVSVAHQRRYQRPYATARRELSENSAIYGQLLSVHLFVSERWQQTIHDTWRDDPAVGAGYFGDAGIHQIDVMHFITDRRVERLIAMSEKRGSRVEITTRVIGELTGGVGFTANFIGNASHYREDLHFHCRDADLLIRGEELTRFRNNLAEPVTDLVPDSNPVSAFLDSIESGRETVSPPEIALPIWAWTQAVLRSAKNQEWVKS